MQKRKTHARSTQLSCAIDGEDAKKKKRKNSRDEQKRNIHGRLRVFWVFCEVWMHVNTYIQICFYVDDDIFWCCCSLLPSFSPMIAFLYLWFTLNLSNKSWPGQHERTHTDTRASEPAGWRTGKGTPLHAYSYRSQACLPLVPFNIFFFFASFTFTPFIIFFFFFFARRSEIVYACIWTFRRFRLQPRVLPRHFCCIETVLNANIVFFPLPRQKHNSVWNVSK